MQSGFLPKTMTWVMAKNDDIGVSDPIYECVCWHSDASIEFVCWLRFKLVFSVKYSLCMMYMRHWSYLHTGVKLVSRHWIWYHIVTECTKTSIFADCFHLSSYILLNIVWPFIVQDYEALFVKEWALFQVINVDMVQVSIIISIFCRVRRSELLFSIEYYLDIHSSR
jgi:hypothetical protein